MTNKLRQTVMALSLLPGLSAPISSAIASTVSDIVDTPNLGESVDKTLTANELEAMDIERERRYKEALENIKQSTKDLDETRDILCGMLNDMDATLSGTKDREGNVFELSEVPDQCK